ncbi:hypothetical protein FAM09_11790 [Niastella caeni]|uniref:Beta-lactamase-inhibitor-like PepSY-like domain-containing protein n=1 Tax=Niastella caeni TaxID=2569763 RepID=A0A4S8HVH5_9BACT|nr:hypothetical protein [Niastella caeni]THU39191.1 hypothetical protein FAM09_11790 [Niastella caeni]
MKNLFVPLVACSVFFITTMLAHAQPDMKKQDYKNVAALANEPASSPHNTMADFRHIPIKAVRNFKSTWQHVDNEAWYQIKDGYRARFTENGVLYLVTYDKKGKWLHTIRQYDEAKMDRDLRAQVRSVYFDYNILLVEEIEQLLKPLIYVIHLEDKTSFKNIRFCDREMTVVSEIQKL